MVTAAMLAGWWGLLNVAIDAPKAPEDLAAWMEQLAIKHTLLTSKKAAYWIASISTCNSNSKQLWGCLNSLMQHDLVSPHQPAVTAELLSSFFQKQSRGHSRIYYSVYTSEIYWPAKQQSGRVFALHNDWNTSSDSVLSCQILCTWPCTSPPFHGVTRAILPFIHFICNTSLRDGVLPDAEKHAIVTPILKTADLDPDNTKSHRPISNLSFVSKLIERIVYHRLTSYLSQHNLLSTLHSAYRQNHSTETATLKVVSDTFDAADAGQITLLAMLDLSAAFDTVNHVTLLERLQRSYGIGGMVLK